MASGFFDVMLQEEFAEGVPGDFETAGDDEDFDGEAEGVGGVNGRQGLY